MCIFPFLRLPLVNLANQAEMWGALETFRRRLKEGDTTVAELENLMNQTFARYTDAVVLPYVYLSPFQGS